MYENNFVRCRVMSKSCYKKIVVITIFALAILLFSGCSILQKLGIGEKTNDETQPVSFVYMDEVDAAKISGKTPVKLYFANEDNSKLLAEIRYIKLDERKNDPVSLATEIMLQLIKGPAEGTGLRATIPEGTKLHSPIEIKDKIVIVDLSKEFVENHPGGKEAERMTIYSIVNSLTQIKGIEKVQFKIEGQTSERYKGNFKFDAPFPASPSLNSKEPPVKGKESSIEFSEEKETSGDAESTSDDAVDVSGEDEGTSDDAVDVSGEVEESSGEIEQEILE